MTAYTQAALMTKCKSAKIRNTTLQDQLRCFSLFCERISVDNKRLPTYNPPDNLPSERPDTLWMKADHQPSYSMASSFCELHATWTMLLASASTTRSKTSLHSMPRLGGEDQRTHIPRKRSANDSIRDISIHREKGCSCALLHQRVCDRTELHLATHNPSMRIQSCRALDLACISNKNNSHFLLLLPSSNMAEQNLLHLPIAERIDPQLVADITSRPPWVKIPGTFNARDLGGKIKPGYVFRSGTLENVKEEGLNAMRELGIGVVFDLRSGLERRVNPEVRHVTALEDGGSQG